MHAQWNRLPPIMALWLVAGTALAQDNPRRQPPVAPTHDTRPGLADDARLLVRPRARIGPAIHPGEVRPAHPARPPHHPAAPPPPPSPPRRPPPPPPRPPP